MSTPAPYRRRAPEQRREAVLGAAQELFVEHGPGGTSIDAIAKRAGVAKGTVYLYFPSKEDILQAIETRFNAGIVDRVHAAAEAAGGAPEESVVAWCVELVHAYLDELDVHDMLFYGRTTATREAVADTALVDDLTALAAARGVGAPGATAAFLVGGTTALVDRAILERCTSSREDLVRSIRHLVDGVISGARSIDVTVR